MTESGSDIEYDNVSAEFQSMEEPRKFVMSALGSAPPRAVAFLLQEIKSGRMCGETAHDSFYGLLLRGSEFRVPSADVEGEQHKAFTLLSRACYQLNIRYHEEINCYYEGIGLGMTPITSILLLELAAWAHEALNEKKNISHKRATRYLARPEEFHQPDGVEIYPPYGMMDGVVQED